MPTGGHGILINSARGERLVEAWNTADRAYVLDQLADGLVLEARLPKMVPASHAYSLEGKAVFRDRLMAYVGPLPQFVIVNAWEDGAFIHLTLEDRDRQLLAVTLQVDEEGLVSRITSFRPDR